MAAWLDLTNEFQSQPDGEKIAWLHAKLFEALNAIAAIRNSNVLCYYSAFLQKSHVPAPLVTITFEDVNGYMAGLYGMDFSKPLTLLIHTPGGSPNAAEAIVGYLRNKFTSIEVLVPTLSLSAGTMIALGSDRVIMSKHSQLGPIDPQFVSAGMSVSAQAVVDQFEMAKSEILANRDLAHAWAPVLASIGPALLQEAKNALAYGENMVADWLGKYMFRTEPDAIEKGKRVARHFNDAQTHRSHGRRIDRDAAAGLGLIVEHLEANQMLQESVLSAYHLLTIACETGPAAKIVVGSTGRMWVKNMAVVQSP